MSKVFAVSEIDAQQTIGKRKIASTCSKSSDVR